MVTYNKQGIARKGDRILHSGGPRDRQRKLAQQDELEKIKKELSQYTTDMSTRDVGYSKQQVQALVNNSLEEISIDLESRYTGQIETLTRELESKDVVISKLTDNITKLEEKLDKKDAVILELTNKVTSISGRTYIQQPMDGESEEQISDRPSIDKVFIDPSKKGGESKYNTDHVVAKEETTKGDVSSSIDKLKAIMGTKLPKN